MSYFLKSLRPVLQSVTLSVLSCVPNLAGCASWLLACGWREGRLILPALTALPLCSPSAEVPFPCPGCADGPGRCRVDRGARRCSEPLCPGPPRVHPHHLHRSLLWAEAGAGHAHTGACCACPAQRGLPGNEGSAEPHH